MHNATEVPILSNDRLGREIYRQSGLMVHIDTLGPGIRTTRKLLAFRLGLPFLYQRHRQKSGQDGCDAEEWLSSERLFSVWRRRHVGPITPWRG